MNEINQKYTHTSEEVSDRMRLIASIFQKDAQINDLKREKIQLMQQFYDREMTMYGRMSKIGKEIFEVEHCEVLSGRVREMTESEWKEGSVTKASGQQADKNNSVRGKLDLYNRQPTPTDAQTKSEGKQKKDVPER